MLTTVHESQIVTEKDLPLDLVSDHDLPVDIIVTPRRVINVRQPLAKPSCGVIWDYVTREKVEEIPVLRSLPSCPERFR